jgi:hypothetical protein
MLHVLILTKVFFRKQECPKKGHAHAVLGRFGPFWAVLGCFGPFLGKAFSGKQETPIFGHASAPFCPQKHGFMASPKKGKSDFLKTRMPQKGT